MLDLGERHLLALALSGGLCAAVLFTRSGWERALGVFAAPLAALVDTALLLCAMLLTGGVKSPFALLLPAGVGLAWGLDGKPAARFQAALSAMGVGALAALGGVATGRPEDLFALASVGLAAPALLAAIEIVSAGVPERVVPAPAPAEQAPSGPRARAAAAAPADKRDPAAEILHDLRSPISVLRIYSDLIQEAAEKGQLPTPDHLENLSREIELAEKLVGGVSAPGRPAAPAEPPASTEPPAADLVGILGSLATAYRLAHSGRIRIEFIADRPELLVAADAVGLQRAFRNVIDNAIKYTSENGEVRIRAGAAGSHAFVVVKDTGMGMTAEERSHAFEYAFRGRRAAGRAEGKGFGLALTKEILEANGGRISLTSEVGMGSEVTILLPYARKAK
ncbi:MAG TPA: HAMP domain-containing sensor histidine kinase [Thermoanaerobaculia bacterium]|nr:HAMP domain-containing sensor histidine kinase [Thermoanaerobaculia bacterium]